jgi:hypothetical protein
MKGSFAVMGSTTARQLLFSAQQTTTIVFFNNFNSTNSSTIHFQLKHISTVQLSMFSISSTFQPQLPACFFQWWPVQLSWFFLQL